MGTGYEIVNPTLDESAFGRPDTGRPRYAFYLVAPGGKEEFITARSVPELTAVSKGQARAWGSSEIRRYDKDDPSVALPDRTDAAEE